jgi:hypothetical protein
MADMFYTLLIIWILWRIFGSSSVKRYVFNQHNHYQPKKKEDDVKVSYNKKSTGRKADDEGEYIDFEEIK